MEEYCTMMTDTHVAIFRDERCRQHHKEVMRERRQVDCLTDDIHRGCHREIRHDAQSVNDVRQQHGETHEDIGGEELPPPPAATTAAATAV